VPLAVSRLAHGPHSDIARVQTAIIPREKWEARYRPKPSNDWHARGVYDVDFLLTGGACQAGFLLLLQVMWHTGSTLPGSLFMNKRIRPVHLLRMVGPVLSNVYNV
jgi:hypothetical protein